MVNFTNAISAKTELLTEEHFESCADIELDLVYYNAVLDRYHFRVGQAYNRLLDDLCHFFFNEAPIPDYDIDMLEVSISKNGGIVMRPEPGIKVEDRNQEWAPIHERLRLIIGRCGGKISAAKQGAQGDIFIHELKQRQEKYYLDLTPCVARSAAKAVIGSRGISTAKLFVFSTPGRTVWQKSENLFKGSVIPEKMVIHIDQISNIITDFNKHCSKHRHFYASQWIAVWDQAKQRFKDKKKAGL